MGLVLREEFDFSVRERRGFIVRRADGCLVAAVEPVEAHLLAIAGRSQTQESCRNEVSAHFGPPGLAALRLVTTRLAPLLRTGIRECFGKSGNYKALLPHRPGAMRRLPGPKILHWTVTTRCPRRCLYCYAEPVHGSVAEDSKIGRARLSILLAEAADLGAKGILLSGSEPFLRPDLPEIIGDARALGLEVLLTTKHNISRSLAERLAAAGLECLSLSVDTLDADLSRELIGSAAYPAQVKRSVSNLRRSRLPFAIQSVLTRQTVERIGGVAAFAEREEAAALQLVPFETVRRPIRPFEQTALRVSRDDAERVLEVLRQKHPSLQVSLFKKGGQDRCDELHCDIGATKLFFTPSGRVHRCYKLTDDESLFGLDLKQHSIAAAWHDPVFTDRLVPPAGEYAGTTCGTCLNMRHCNSSGRCIFQAVVDHGHYASPDRGPDCQGQRNQVANEIGT